MRSRPSFLALASDSNLEQKDLNSAVGNILRHIVKDYEKTFIREEFHNLLRLSSSIEWGNYLSVSLANKICIN